MLMGKTYTPEELYAQAIERFQNGQHHSMLYGVACRAYDLGFCDETSLATELKRVYAQYGGGSTDDADCENTAQKVCANGSKTSAPSVTVLTKTEKTEKKEREKKIKAHEARWRKWVVEKMKTILAVQNGGEIEPAKHAEAMQEAIKKIVPNLKKGEYLYCGGCNWDKFDKGYIGDTYEIEYPIEQCFWSPNRLDDRNHTKEHCMAVDYLLLEMDEELEETCWKKETEQYYDEMEAQQLKLWQSLKDALPVKSLIYSGGKSIHALIAVETSTQELEKYRERLTTLYSELHFDTANIDPIRKTRTPYGLRKWYVADDKTLVKDIDVEDQLRKAKSNKIDVKTKAKTWLAEHMVSETSQKIYRLQDCLYIADSVTPVSLETLCNRLQALVDEFVPASDDPVEKAVIDGEVLPLVTPSVEAFLAYKGWELWWDETMMKAKMCTERGIEEDIETIQNRISDEWTMTFSLPTPPNSQKLTACIKQIYKEHSISEANEWFRKLPWDGVDRLPAIYSILGLDSDFEKALVRKWLVQTVAMQENSEALKVPPLGVLTFLGRQNAGKTTFLTSLLPRSKRKWVVEGASMNVDSKDDLRKLMSGVIVELGEVDATLKRDQTRLKAVITAEKQSLRLPYDREITEVYSHVSMCASVNEEQFLKDPTGNRRWWVIEPRSKIDLDRLAKIDKEQLWGQIRHIWDSCDKTRYWEAYGLTDLERAELERRNDNYREDTGYEGAIRETYDFSSTDRSNRLTCTKIALDVINRATTDADKMKTTVSDKELKAMSRSLKALGVRKYASHGISVYLMPPVLSAMDLQSAIDNDTTGVGFGGDADPFLHDPEDTLPEEKAEKIEEITKKIREDEMPF